VGGGISTSRDSRRRTPFSSRRRGGVNVGQGKDRGVHNDKPQGGGGGVWGVGGGEEGSDEKTAGLAPRSTATGKNLTERPNLITLLDSHKGEKGEVN